MADRKPGWELELPVSCGLADDAGFPLRGKVASVDSEIDPKTGTQRWHVVLPNKDGVLAPGMFLCVRLTTSAPHKALLVPERALCSDQGKKFVFVVNDQNIAERRDVTAGQLDDGLRVVSEGLNAEDRVITSGLQQVRPGMTVKPEKAAAN
jgi:RND family efflux transporter MFP subunit